MTTIEAVARLVNSLKGISARRLRQRYRLCIHGSTCGLRRTSPRRPAAPDGRRSRRTSASSAFRPGRGPIPPRTAGLRGVDPLAASAYVSSGAACSFLAAAVVVGGRGLQGAAPSAYAAAAAMAMVGTALAIAAFLAGMARVGSAWASIASSFEPVFTVALGVVVLGDRLSPGKVVGGLAVVAGAVLLPLLGGAREAVGSSLQPEYTPTRGSTRR
jgi:uncharacterized membrane protein